MNMAVIGGLERDKKFMDHIKELYAYRQMIFSLVHKELRGRYKGSVLGFAWTFINPLLQLCVYTMVFSVIMKASIEKYYIFLFVALIPWIFFSTSVTGGSTSILSAGDMVKKIYFPREVLPISFVTGAFINMLLCFLVVFGVLFVTGFGFNYFALLYLPAVMMVEYILSIGFALLVSSLTIYFRDLSYILGIITMAWQYLTPVMYSSDMVPARLLFVWNLNPMTPVIEAYRQILYYRQIPNMSTLLLTIIMGFISVAAGYIIFRCLQKGFAEEL